MGTQKKKVVDFHHVIMFNHHVSQRKRNYIWNDGCPWLPVPLTSEWLFSHRNGELG